MEATSHLISKDTDYLLIRVTAECRRGFRFQ